MVSPDPSRAFSGPVGRTVCRQGLPVAIGLAGHALFNLIDLFMLGRLGEAAVAGTHVATVWHFLPMILGNGVTVATLSVLSRLLGDPGRVADARAFANWAVVFMAALGVVLGLVGAATADACVRAQGLSEGAAYEVGVDYLVVSHLGTITMFVLMQVTTSMRAVGSAGLSAALLLGANVLNIALNLPLIFGWEALGVPALGAVGAAWATVAARTLGVVAAVIWLRRTRSALRWAAPPTWSPPAGVRGRELLRLAGPATLQMVVRAATVLVFTRLTVDVGGLPAVTAIGLTTRLDTVVLFASIGYSGAATAVVGHAVARGADAHVLRRARCVARWAGVQAFALGAVVVLGVWSVAPQLAHWFVPAASAEVVGLVAFYVASAMLGQPFAAAGVALTGALHGAGATVRPLLVDVVGFGGVGLLVSCLDRESWTVAGVWWGFAALQVLVLLGHIGVVERSNWLGAAKLRAGPDTLTG